MSFGLFDSLGLLGSLGLGSLLFDDLLDSGSLGLLGRSLFLTLLSRLASLLGSRGLFGGFDFVYQWEGFGLVSLGTDILQVVDFALGFLVVLEGLLVWLGDLLVRLGDLFVNFFGRLLGDFDFLDLFVSADEFDLLDSVGVSFVSFDNHSKIGGWMC